MSLFKEVDIDHDKFEPRDYVYLQYTTLTILDVIMGCVILRVRKVLPFGVFLGGQNGHGTWKDHMHNCVLCQLPNVDGQID